MAVQDRDCLNNISTKLKLSFMNSCTDSKIKMTIHVYKLSENSNSTIITATYICI